MKNPEFNAMELRRSLMDIEQLCETIVGNLAQMPPSKAGRYAVSVVKQLEALAHKALVAPRTGEAR